MKTRLISGLLAIAILVGPLIWAMPPAQASVSAQGQGATFA